MPVKLVFVFCALIEKENLGLGLCTVIDIITPGEVWLRGEVRYYLDKLVH